MKEVLWKVDGKERKGTRIEADFVEEKQYEVYVSYVFVKVGTTEETKATEKIIIEGKSREIVPILEVASDGNNALDNLYATVDVKFDASGTMVRSGKIAKFVFDFGEGKPLSEGEAVKIYRYTIPGEYTVKLTVVKTDGAKESISRKLVVKELAKKLEIESGISQGTSGKEAEFRVKEGTIGQIESYSWDF
jgi:PKD repeat protein